VYRRLLLQVASTYCGGRPPGRNLLLIGHDQVWRRLVTVPVLGDAAQPAFHAQVLGGEIRDAVLRQARVHAHSRARDVA
jgi:hypothetical protein